MTDVTLTRDEIDAAELADWRQFGPLLRGRFRSGNFAIGVHLVERIGAVADQLGHQPDIDLRHRHVDVTLSGVDAGGITAQDVSLASRISQVAAELMIPAQPSAVSVVELALDTPDHGRIKPFWRAVLGYVDNPLADDEVRAADAGSPPIWFQASGSDEPRQRFHLDVRVPGEVAQQRIDATVAAGGRVVDEAPTFTVLADADGNKACVCI